MCPSRGLPMDLVDGTVWQEVCRLLADPGQVLAEYDRRLAGEQTGTQQEELSGLERQLRQAERTRERLIEVYTEGVITKEDFTARLGRLDQRVAQLRAQREAVQQLVAQEAELRLVVGRLEAFTTAVEQGLETATVALQRQLITTLVKRIDVEPGSVRIVFRVEPGPAPPSHGLHFCTDRPTDVRWMERETAREARASGSVCTRQGAIPILYSPYSSPNFPLR